MAFFRRRVPKHARYEPPPPVPIAPVERVVEEGVLISATTVRMAIKNRLIIAALRDALDFDRDALAEVAREQFLVLANENDETADRLTGFDHPGDASEEHLRRPVVHRMLADALRTAANDRSRIDAIVAEARDVAWHEVGSELTRRLRARELLPETDPEYRRDRQERIREFIDYDLQDLDAIQRPETPGPPP